MREKSKFKVRKKEHSSSVIQTQCFISHSRCVDYLLIGSWCETGKGRPIVVAAERGMTKQEKDRE